MGCYDEVFKSIQLASVYTLYYDVDFTKQKVKNFNSILTRHHQEVVDHKMDVWELERNIKQQIHFDCEKAAYQFPYRAKIKMSGVKVKSKNLKSTMQNIDDALRLYLIIAVYTLRKNYRFTPEQINDWWEHVKDFCLLYAQGMKDEHVIQYFIQECNLEITE